MMPPPAPGVTGKKLPSPRKASSTSQDSRIGSFGKGKGRAEDPVEILSDGETDLGILNSSELGGLRQNCKS